MDWTFPYLTLYYFFCSVLPLYASLQNTTFSPALPAYSLLSPLCFCIYCCSRRLLFYLPPVPCCCHTTLLACLWVTASLASLPLHYLLSYLSLLYYTHTRFSLQTWILLSLLPTFTTTTPLHISPTHTWHVSRSLCAVQDRTRTMFWRCLHVFAFWDAWFRGGDMATGAPLKRGGVIFHC